MGIAHGILYILLMGWIYPLRMVLQMVWQLHRTCDNFTRRCHFLWCNITPSGYLWERYIPWDHPRIHPRIGTRALPIPMRYYYSMWYTSCTSSGYSACGRCSTGYPHMLHGCNILGIVHITSSWGYSVYTYICSTTGGMPHACSVTVYAQNTTTTSWMWYLHSVVFLVICPTGRMYAISRIWASWRCGAIPQDTSRC
jgi:hypothetical protein